MILLHGAKYTKEDWSTSGILDDICIKGAAGGGDSDSGGFSITALDLSVKADGDGFIDAFDALVNQGVLSGKPLVVISPSASGKSIVSLGASAMNPMTSSSAKAVLKKMIKVWIPVASPAVLSVKEDGVLRSFSSLGIEILAINGDGDGMGKRVTQRLVQVGAKGVELKGGHAVYLDSPNEFVETVLSFMEGWKDQS